MRVKLLLKNINKKQTKTATRIFCITKCLHFKSKIIFFNKTKPKKNCSKTQDKKKRFRFQWR